MNKTLIVVVIAIIILAVGHVLLQGKQPATLPDLTEQAAQEEIREEVMEEDAVMKEATEEGDSATEEDSMMEEEATLEGELMLEEDIKAE